MSPSVFSDLFSGGIKGFVLDETEEWDGNMWALLQQSQWIHRNYHGEMTYVPISLFITDPAEACSLRPISHWISVLLRLTGQEAQGHAKWVENGNDISFWPAGLLSIPDRMQKDQKVLLEHMDNDSATKRRKLFKTKSVRKLQGFVFLIMCLFACLIPRTVQCSALLINLILKVCERLVLMFKCHSLPVYIFDIIDQSKSSVVVTTTIPVKYPVSARKENKGKKRFFPAVLPY